MSIIDFIPKDDLHWDEDSKKHLILSQKEIENVLRSCFKCGLDQGDTLKVLRQYEDYKTADILFKNFLEGKIGIYSFGSNGSPIFEAPKNQYLDLVLIYAGCYSEFEHLYKIPYTEGQFLACSQPIDLIPFDKIFHTVSRWCKERGFDLKAKENPDDFSTWSKEPDAEVADEIKSKTWRIVELSSNDDYLRLKLEIGLWFEHDS